MRCTRCSHAPILLSRILVLYAISDHSSSCVISWVLPSDCNSPFIHQGASHNVITGIPPALITICNRLSKELQLSGSGCDGSGQGSDSPQAIIGTSSYTMPSLISDLT